MNPWPAAIAFVLDHEGGYVNDPADPGGETKYGISKRAHPDLDIQALTREQAQAIYHTDYWVPLRAAEMPPPVALALFDWTVHSGRYEAVSRVQRMLGVWIDGTVGEDTLAAIQKRDSGQLALDIIRTRTRFLGRWIAAKPERMRFLVGFMVRLLDLAVACFRLQAQ